MLKWLMAVDGSPASLRTIDVVAKWARAGLSVEIILIQVAPPVPDVGAGSAAAWHDAVEREQQQVLAEAESRAFGGGLRVRAKLASRGPVAPAIVRAAEEHEVDQIAMGLHGLASPGDADGMPTRARNRQRCGGPPRPWRCSQSSTAARATARGPGADSIRS